MQSRPAGRPDSQRRDPYAEPQPATYRDPGTYRGQRSYGDHGDPGGRYDDGYYREPDDWYDSDDQYWDDEPGYNYEEYEERGSKTMLWVAVSLTIGIVLGAVGTVFGTSVIEARASDAEVADGNPAAADGGGGGLEPGANGEGTSDPTATTGAGGDGAGDLPTTAVGGATPPVEGSDPAGEPNTVAPTGNPLGCSIDASGAAIVEVANDSTELSDFLLNVDILDASGATVRQEATDIYAVRPGERTVENLFLEESGGAACTIVNSAREPVEVTLEANPDVSACEVIPGDIGAELQASITITNSTAAASEYFVDLAIVDETGLRRGTGFVDLPDLGPQESTNVPVDTLVGYAPGYGCQVVGVFRSGS